MASVRNHPSPSPLDAPKIDLFGNHGVCECTVFLYIFDTGAAIAIKPVRKDLLADQHAAQKLAEITWKQGRVADCC